MFVGLIIFFLARKFLKKSQSTNGHQHKNKMDTPSREETEQSLWKRLVQKSHGFDHTLLLNKQLNSNFS